jgi:fucose 4-O-acetylase-like acetyltransferase
MRHAVVMLEERCAIEEKARLSYIDIGKGIGIIFVVLGHLFRDNPLKIWIYSFHMPLFFFISGYLNARARENSLRELLQKRLKSLMLPYFGFGAITYLYWLLIEHRFLTDPSPAGLFRPIIGILVGTCEDGWLRFNPVLWFLPCLFVVEISFASIRKLRTSTWMTVAVLACACTGCWIARTPWLAVPWSANIALTGVSFYAVGFLVCRRGLCDGLSTAGSFLLLSIAIVVNVASSHKNGPVNMAHGQYGNCLLYYIGALSGIAFIYLASRLIGRGTMLSRIGRDSLVIFCIHQQIFRIILKLSSVVTRLDMNGIRDSAVGSLGITAMTVAIALCFASIIRLHASILIGTPSQAAR